MHSIIFIIRSKMIKAPINLILHLYKQKKPQKNMTPFVSLLHNSLTWKKVMKNDVR